VRDARIACALLALGAARSAPAADVALLKSAETAAWRPAIEALRRVAAGHNVQEFDVHGDRGEADRIVAALKGKAAAIVTLGPLAAQAAHEGAPELPLVACMVSDPAKLGLAPAPNLSGVALYPPVKNQLAAFRMVNPRGVRIGVVYSAESVGKLVQEAQKAASVVRLSIVEKAIVSDKDVPQALRALLTGDSAVDALWLPPDPLLLGEDARRYIFQETLKAGKPVYTFSPALVQEGALVSNGADMANTGEQAGELLLRLLGPEKGTRIELAIPRAELVINKKVADRLKIEIPADALKAAAKVY
jgi:putative ABC transport system substrate-binding protein